MTRRRSTAADIVFVLLLIQGSASLLAAISGFFLARAGEPLMAAYGLAGLLLAIGTWAIGGGVVAGAGWARWWALGLELFTLAAVELQLLLPIGASIYPAALLTNLILPAAVIVLLFSRRESSPQGTIT